MDDDKDLLPEMIALLYAVDNRSYDEIQKELHISKSTVWRHLTKTKGLYEEYRRASPELLERAPEIRQAINRRMLGVGKQMETLVERLNRISGRETLRSVNVFPSTTRDAPPAGNSWEAAAVTFGRAAAGHVQSLLSKAAKDGGRLVVGVARGRTLRSMVDGVRELKLPDGWGGPGKRIAFFPVWGDPPEDPTRADSKDLLFDESTIGSSRLAREFAILGNGTKVGVPSLEGSPAIIPLGFDSEQRAVIKDYISGMPSHKRVYGASKGGKPGALFDVTLLAPLKEADEMPQSGCFQIILAAVRNVLHIRVFDAACDMVVDVNEKKLSAKGPQLRELKKQLEGLWPPHTLTPPERDRLHAAVVRVIDYAPKPLIDEMNTFLAAVGSARDHFPVLWHKGVAEYIGADLDRIERCFLGDLGGVAIAKEPADPADSEFRDAITELWTGPSIEQVKRCAEQARGGNRAGLGVIAFAVGSRRAEVVYECIKRGLINELLVDTDLAAALVKGPPFPEPGVRSSR